MKLITAALCLLCAPALLAQQFTWDYIAKHDFTLSGTTHALTIQKPAGASRTAKFDSAAVSCDTDFTVSVERDGTAASATTLSVSKMNDSQPANEMLAYSPSNVGSGTSLSQTYRLDAKSLVSISLSGKGLESAGNNLSLKLTSTSGASCGITIKWQEF